MTRPDRGDSWRRDTTPGLLVIVFGIGIIGFVLLVVAGLSVPAFVAADEAVSEAARSVESPVLDGAATALTRLGDIEAMLGVSAVISIGLYLTKRKPEAVLFASNVVLGTALGSLFKDVFQRVRPGLEVARIPLPDTYSFPSGHALASFLVFGTITFLVMGEAKRLSTLIWVAAVCFALAAGVAASRVYLGVHWFGDIVASWLLGTAWMAVTIASYFWFTRQRVG